MIGQEITASRRDIPRAEQPRPDRARACWRTLNGSWDFAFFPEDAAAEEAAFDRQTYPHTITVPFSWGTPLSGVAERRAGTGWYRRSAVFETPGRIFLCFGAVDFDAAVYVNGQPAGTHRGGYEPFSLDITALWQAGENRLEVRAQDLRRDCQPYGKQGYGDAQGIWQPVWLEARPQAYLEDFRFVTRCDGRVELTAAAHAPDSAMVRADFGGVTATGAVCAGTASLSFRIPAPRLWSPEDPYLYEGTLTLGEDVVSTYFGLREISYGCVDGRADPWILLNGKPVYLQGTLDQSYNPGGGFTWPSEEELEAEAWRLKRLGLNFVRIHVKAEEPRRLWWLDRLGVLVMEDVPCFWGPPTPEAMENLEALWPQMLRRDFNHPSIIAWALFNETWGLLSPGAPDRVYTPETQEWVRSVWQRAKALDPTRLIEDNSACRHDHVVTDLNTWHFYVNGHDALRQEIRRHADGVYPGSGFNFIGDNVQSGQPFLNSECGMVWGVEGSAGDSDLAWQYHDMLNEFRLVEKLCGFVFTEYHDVVNEFNGYYRLHGQDKDFGYEGFCRGMSLRDLHAEDFAAVDCPPCRTVRGGQETRTPVVLSSFSDAHHADGLTLRWELWHESPVGRVFDAAGSRETGPFGWGVTPLGDIDLTMPRENAVAVLSLYLCRGDQVISRNFTTFDVRCPLDRDTLELSLEDGQAEGFSPMWTALGRQKRNLGGSGSIRWDVELPWTDIGALVIDLEAGAKRVLSKDLGKHDKSVPEGDFMLGFRVDRGAFPNSYWMTDEDVVYSRLELLADGVSLGEYALRGDPADARGVLSWQYQPSDRHLDEAGSYGEAIHAAIPSRLLPAMARRGRFTLTLRVTGNGMALYGRCAGRYPWGLSIRRPY